jgi:glucan phosphoethanolaminetransferase (alkaline phosphatase superfamily)
LLAFVLISLFTTIHSELGKQISTGESPFFSWARTNMPVLLLVGLAYLLMAQWVQRLELRLHDRPYPRGMKALVWSEAVAIGILVLGFLHWWEGALPWGHVLLQLSILLQTLATLGRSGSTNFYLSSDQLSRPEKGSFLFLLLLFLLAAAPAFLDPSWNTMRDYVYLDTSFEILLSRILPPLFSGVTGLWFGIGTLAILAGFRALRMRGYGQKGLGGILFFLPFFFISGLYAAIWLKSLIHAIHWELDKLQLMPAMVPLFILLCGGGGALFSAAFQRISSHVPRARERSQIGIVALSMGAVLLFPISWILTRRECGPWCWRFLRISCLLGSLLLGSLVLYGNLFDPWFTAFSYLKGAILKVMAVVAAGILVLVFDALFPVSSLASLKTGVKSVVMAVVFFVGFLPFVLSEGYRETKVANMQFNEFSRVDATYARELANAMGLGRWIRLGQDPVMNNHPEPWPQPWTLKKTHPSLLPKDFNLMVIVVDALRGDAFHSAGYDRDLTSFLDRWALGETISFQRAYSQGGGSFAAFPFLVAGRSPFNLYGPELYKENLYLKLAQAEGIKTMMVIKEFGPRAIFPPDYPVIELDRYKTGSDGRSVPADEVFRWAEIAIDKLAEGERFLCFLHLMDVHNDLWKKEDGLDFGDTPREIYDNNLSYVDRAFERFVSWLKEKGIYHRTVILFTSDHGEQFWEHGASLHGHTLYEEEIRIPLILLAHGIRKRVEEVPVLAADAAPTLVDLAGYSVDPPYDDPHMGISLVPLLTGKERDRYLKRDIVGRASFKRRYFLYRNWEWKFVYFAELDLLQLFNTVKDPLERTNLLQENLDLSEELERELFGYLERVEGKTYRPLLSGTHAGN